MFILSIDSSTSKSGVALFYNGQLVKSFLVIHNINEQNAHLNWNKAIYDAVVEIYQLVKNDALIAIIEVPNGSSNMKVLGKLKQFAGVWIGTILTYFYNQNNNINNINIIEIQANNWRASYGLNSLNRDEAKDAAIKLVNNFYGLDLTTIKANKWDAKKQVYKEVKAQGDDVAEAILIGRLYV